MSALFNSFVKKSKNSILGKLSLSLLGIIISSVLIYLNNDYSWSYFNFIGLYFSYNRRCYDSKGKAYFLGLKGKDGLIIEL